MDGSDVEMYAVCALEEDLDFTMLRGRNWGEAARIVFSEYGCILSGLTVSLPAVDQDKKAAGVGERGEGGEGWHGGQLWRR